MQIITFLSVDKLASKVIVILGKSVVSSLSYSFATFATNGATKSQIMQIFWKVVCCLVKRKF